MDASSTIEAKRALRRTMRRVRAALVDRDARSALLWAEVERLCARIAVTRTSSPLTVLAFQGVGGEPNTTVLVERLHAAGHAVVLPRVEGEHIVAVGHRRGDSLELGAFGIPEPVGPPVDPQTIDIVLVPGLAFTADGRRLGQGGGFYDRFLPLVRPDCVTCGVCFAEQVVDDLPDEPHDQRLAMVITDR